MDFALLCCEGWMDGLFGLPYDMALYCLVGDIECAIEHEYMNQPACVAHSYMVVFCLSNLFQLPVQTCSTVLPSINRTWVYSLTPLCI